MKGRNSEKKYGLLPAIKDVGSIVQFKLAFGDKYVDLKIGKEI